MPTLRTQPPCHEEAQGEAHVERKQEPEPMCQPPYGRAILEVEPLPQLSHEQTPCGAETSCFQQDLPKTKIPEQNTHYCCSKPLSFRMVHHAICNLYPKFAQNDHGLPPAWSSTGGGWPVSRGPCFSHFTLARVSGLFPGWVDE